MSQGGKKALSLASFATCVCVSGQVEAVSVWGRVLPLDPKAINAVIFARTDVCRWVWSTPRRYSGILCMCAGVSVCAGMMSPFRPSSGSRPPRAFADWSQEPASEAPISYL